MLRIIFANISQNIIDHGDYCSRNYKTLTIRDMTHIIYDATHLLQNFMSSAIFPKVNDSRNISFLKREQRVFQERTT